MKKFKQFISESIRDKMVGKSNEEILRDIKDLKPEEKFANACEHHMTWLVEHLLKEGVDPSFNDNMCLINCGLLEYDDIVKLLLKNDKVIDKLYQTQLYKAESDIYSKYDTNDGNYYEDGNGNPINLDDDGIKDFVDWDINDVEWDDEDDYYDEGEEYYQ